MTSVLSAGLWLGNAGRPKLAVSRKIAEVSSIESCASNIGGQLEARWLPRGDSPTVVRPSLGALDESADERHFDGAALVSAPATEGGAW